MIEHLTSIVAIDKHGAIGCNNRLPWSIKSDMAFFRKTTMGNTVIMGRKTYESIGGCLKGRANLVLSHSYGLFSSTPTCTLVNSVEETMASALTNGGLDTFVIGGAATYSEFSQLVDRYLVTLVDHSAMDADAFLSQKIRQEFGGWQAEEIAHYPAEPGRDEFPFRIVSFMAPDALERRETRKALANQFLDKRLNQTQKKARHRAAPDKSAQAAFLF